MLPQFPEFKMLEMSDRNYIESLTAKHPPYSDFNFVSMWSWNISGEMKISELNGNLAVLFNDYVTGEPFYSFLGCNMVNETIETLLAWSEEKGLKTRLQLVPEEVVELLDTKKYKTAEQPDHSDYIISVERLLPHDGSGRKLSSRRKLIKKFKENSTFEIKEIDINDLNIRNELNKVFIRWELQLENGINNIEHLRQALVRLLDMEDKKGIMSFGAYLDGELIGYSINELCPDNYVVGHFQQGNIKVFPGIYALLMHETSPFFNDLGYKLINLEQDLDIPGLRKWKSSHMPVAFLRKFIVSRVDNRFVYNLLKRIINL
jgi:hypothetical protein